MQNSIFATPLVLTGALAVVIVIVTWRHHPWKNKYGTPSWDFSSSFAANLAVLTGAVNAFLQLVVSGLTPAAKNQVLIEAAVFGIITASAPLIGSAWKTPGLQTYFAGVLAAVLVTAVGAFGQLSVLLNLLPKELADFRPALYFGDVAIFVYCLSTTDVLARTSPTAAGKTLVPGVPQRWALP